MRMGYSMKIAKLIRIILTGFTVFAAVNLWAQDKGPARGGRGAGMEALVNQLDLSDEQQDQIKALYAESRDSRQAILAAHGIEMGKGVRPDREKMKEAQPEIAALRKATDSKVEAILTKEQLAQLKELRANAGGQGEGKRRNQGGE